MVKTFNLDNKVILITGGYGYLGRAVSESILFHGGILYILGKSRSKFQDAFSQIDNRLRKRLHFIKCDISETEDIVSAFKNVYDIEGKIDVLINNAFYSSGSSPESMSDEEWSNGIDGVLSSTFRCIRSIIPYFKLSKSGKIINVSSMYGIVSPEFNIYDDFPEFLNPPHYGSAKAGIIQLSKYYASYLGSLNVNVNTVTPGPFPSNEVQERSHFIKALKEKTCLNRIGFPDDLAGAFIFLASNASDFITGQNIIIDGGWTTK